MLQKGFINSGRSPQIWLKVLVCGNTYLWIRKQFNRNRIKIKIYKKNRQFQLNWLNHQIKWNKAFKKYKNRVKTWRSLTYQATNLIHRFKCLKNSQKSQFWYMFNHKLLNYWKLSNKTKNSSYNFMIELTNWMKMWIIWWEGIVKSHKNITNLLNKIIK